jgi:hypothetical protein
MRKPLCTAALLIGMGAPQAHAACDQPDLGGNWTSFSVGHADTGETGVQECTVRINRKGKFRSGTRCVDDSTLKTSGLRVLRSCAVRGTFEQTFRVSAAQPAK